MKNKKGLKIVGIILLVIVVLIIAGNVIIKNISGKINNVNSMEMEGLFDEIEVKSENITSYVKGTGEITSFNIQTLDIPSQAKISENYAFDGDIVTKKQKLVKINMDGYITTYSSPIDGMFFITQGEEGNLYQIYDLNNIGLEFYVSENDVATLAIDQVATIRITALKKEFEGKVTYISKLPTGGKFKVKVSIPYTDEIKFGYGASVKVRVAEKENAIVIPYNALQVNNDNEYYVIKSEHKDYLYNFYMYGTTISEDVKTYVEVGSITNEEVEIISGLKNGDKIIEWTW